MSRRIKSTDLTPAELRKLRFDVARYLGFSSIQSEFSGEPAFGYRNGKQETIPQYSTDLNACREFEKELTDDEWIDYDMFLMCITEGMEGHSMSPRGRIHADAVQKCWARIMVEEDKSKASGGT